MTAPIAILRQWAQLSPKERDQRLEQLAPEQRARVAVLSQEIKKSQRQRPLAWVECWHAEGVAESPDGPRRRTSQRLAAQLALQANVLEAFVLGGNRSGKSELGAVLCLAFAQGRDHPDVMAWAEANGLDISQIPTGPGAVWDVSLTHQDSRRYVRSKYDRLAPPGSKWRNREADNEAELVLPGGGKIVFKAVTQGKDGFQGDAVRFIRFDEEPKDPEVVAEAMMRTVDLNGRIIYTMTPLSGWTKLLREKVERPAANTRVVWLHGEDNPFVPRHALQARLARYGSNARAARARGEIAALEGRVFSAFSRQVHVRHFDEIDPEWPRYQAGDWGTRVPTAIGHAVWIPHLSAIYLRREFYRSETTLRTRAGALRCLELGKHHPDVVEWAARMGIDLNDLPDWPEDKVVDARWMDPEDATANRTLTLEYGIPIRPAKKDVKYGIDVVDYFLSPDALGDVHLFIDPDCIETLREIDGYVWDDHKDRPKPGPDDHAMDMLRYLCVGIARIYGMGPKGA